MITTLTPPPKYRVCPPRNPGPSDHMQRSETQQAACAGDLSGWASNGPLGTLTAGTLSCHERHLPPSPPTPPRPPRRSSQRQGERQTDGQTGQEPWRATPAVGTCSALLPGTQTALRCLARAVSADSRGADHKHSLAAEHPTS